MKKPPVGPGTFCPLSILIFYILAGNIFRSLKQELLRGAPGKIRKILKLKMLVKTAGDLPHGEGKSRT
jgi:hypothetical protein